MEPEWQSHGFSPNMADFLTDAELAFVLNEEEEVTQQLSRPHTPFSQETRVDDNLEEVDPIKECQICSEEKHTDLYPQMTAGSGCRCLSDVCLICMQQHIKSQTESKEWKEGSLTCPICNRPLTPQEIEQYADSDTFKTHLSYMIDRTVKDMPNFTRCPNPDCDYGQIHEGGDARPFVTCAACNMQFCFRHGIPTQRPEQPPSQHEDMSCDEYDRYLVDPMNFRSAHQRQQERAAVERREEEAVARARERMERILERRREAAIAADESKTMMEENKRKEENAAREVRERRGLEIRERREREQRQRQELREHEQRQRQELRQSREREARERKEQKEREERARLEQRRYEQEREKEELERKARAEEILLRKLEDEQSEKLIEVLTKGCPRCGKRIEKNEGW